MIVLPFPHSNAMLSHYAVSPYMLCLLPGMLFILTAFKVWSLILQVQGSWYVVIWKSSWTPWKLIILTYIVLPSIFLALLFSLFSSQLLDLRLELIIISTPGTFITNGPCWIPFFYSPSSVTLINISFPSMGNHFNMFYVYPWAIITLVKHKIFFVSGHF